jgi:cytochrome oxidase Cu insertion factor (SCO1/SenC/PrrC family)
MKKGLFLIAILLVPSVVYLLFSLGQHNTARLGFYGEVESISENGDTVFRSVHIPKLFARDGNAVDLTSLNGRVLVVDIFDQPCGDACYDKISTLNNYLNRIGLNEEWILLSISLNPMGMSELKALSEKNLYKGGNWVFATTESKHDIDELVESLFVSTQQVGGINEMPTSKVVVLDQDQRIREFFDLKLQQDNKTLQDAIKLLIQEPHISWKER